jgi:predicted DNA binding CopG/RHH family protein
MRIPRLKDVKIDWEETQRIREMMKNRKKTRITIHLDGDLVEHLKYLAVKNGGKYQTLLNHLIREALGKRTAQEERLSKLEKEVEKLKRKTA